MKNTYYKDQLERLNTDGISITFQLSDGQGKETHNLTLNDESMSEFIKFFKKYKSDRKKIKITNKLIKEVIKHGESSWHDQKWHDNDNRLDYCAIQYVLSENKNNTKLSWSELKEQATKYLGNLK